MLNRDGDGSIAGAIAAIDWAVEAKQRGRRRSASCPRRGVAPASRKALTDAIERAGNAGHALRRPRPATRTLERRAGPDLPVRGRARRTSSASRRRRGNDQLTAFSDYGATHVDLAAPGEAIVSTVPRGVVPGCGQSLYCALDGTSMAAPMVTRRRGARRDGRPVADRGRAADTAGPGRRHRALRCPARSSAVAGSTSARPSPAVRADRAAPAERPEPARGRRAAHGSATLAWTVAGIERERDGDQRLPRSTARAGPPVVGERPQAHRLRARGQRERGVLGPGPQRASGRAHRSSEAARGR